MHLCKGRAAKLVYCRLANELCSLWSCRSLSFHGCSDAFQTWNLWPSGGKSFSCSMLISGALIVAKISLLRACPAVLSLWYCTVKLDEEKSKHAGLAQEIGFIIA